MTRWAIPRNLLLALTVLAGLAFAGKGLFGKKEAPPPEPEPVAQPAPEAPPPPPPEPAPRLFPDGVPVPVQQIPDGLANLSAQGCNGCHYAAHEAWEDSAHADAWRA